MRNFDPRKQLEVTLIENLQRKDLNPVEEAAGIQAYINQFSPDPEEAQRLGRSRPALANTLRLLQLPDEILVMIQEGSSRRARLTWWPWRTLVAADGPDHRGEGSVGAPDGKLVAQHKSERAKKKPRPAAGPEASTLADLMRETMGTSGSRPWHPPAGQSSWTTTPGGPGPHLGADGAAQGLRPCSPRETIPLPRGPAAGDLPLMPDMGLQGPAAPDFDSVSP